MSNSRAAILALVLASQLPSVLAQTIVRDDVRQSIIGSRANAFIAAMVDLSEISELAASTLTISGNPDTDVSMIKLPYQHDFALENGWPELHVEAGLGYIVGRMSFTDLWQGALPGQETKVNTRWEGVSGCVGLGPRFDLGSGLHFTTVVDGSISYVENTALYGGPGAAMTAAALDGLLFNWNATTLAYGGALRLEHDTGLTDQLTLSSLLRYDLRRFDVVHSTDAAQDISETVQRAIARVELRGPTGITVLEDQLDWNTHLGYVRLLGPDDDILGFVDYFEVGAGLKRPVAVAGLSAMTLSGALIFGEDVQGWSIGFGIEF